MTSQVGANPSSQDLNAEAYDRLVTVIELNQGVLAPIIAVCDDRRLREQIIQRYETELSPWHTYRLQLDRQEPSLIAALAKWAAQTQISPSEAIVITVTGAEALAWMTLQKDDPNPTELAKFFGYLQWTREGLREFTYPIVLWVTERIFKLLSRNAPDFWSWRENVVRFVADLPSPPPNKSIPQPPFTPSQLNTSRPNTSRPNTSRPNTSRLSLEDLQAQIDQLQAREGSQAAGLATLYDQMAQAYVDRIQTGKAADVVREQTLAIRAFKQAIALQTAKGLDFARMTTFLSLGNLYSQIGNYPQAMDAYQQSLEIARQLGYPQGEAAALGNLGIAYHRLGQYERAIDFQQQYLTISREIGDRRGEGNSLGNLGNAYQGLGQYERAIDFHQQHLMISREIGDRRSEGFALGSLGNAYYSLGQYERAIDFQQQYLTIAREIGDRRGEGNSLGNLGNAYQGLGQHERAIDFHQQHLTIAREIGDRQGEDIALGNLGFAYYGLGQYERAIDLHQQHLTIAREIGDRQGEGVALVNIGATQLKRSQYPESLTNNQAALEIFRGIGDKANEAEALKNLAELHQALGEVEVARQYGQQALALATELGIPLAKECEELLQSLGESS